MEAGFAALGTSPTGGVAVSGPGDVGCCLALVLVRSMHEEDYV